MESCLDFLDQIKEKRGFKSDFELARYLGINRARVSNYRRVRDLPDDELCVLIAEELGIEPGYVLACVNAQRTKSNRARMVWTSLARSLENPDKFFEVGGRR